MCPLLMKMRKYFFFVVISLLFIIPFPVHSESFILTCISNKENFTKTYEVNTHSKTILHLSSFDPLNDQRYRVNNFYETIKWNYPIVYAFTDKTSRLPSFAVFNFDKLTASTSGHYEDYEPYPQFFKCSRS